MSSIDIDTDPCDLSSSLLFISAFTERLNDNMDKCIVFSLLMLIVTGTHVKQEEQVVHLRVVKSPHLDCTSPLKPDDMTVASFDKAGKPIMNLLAEGGHGVRAQLLTGTVFTAHTNYSCTFPKTSLGHPQDVTAYPHNNGTIFIDGGYLAYWIVDAPLPAWANATTCGAFVRTEDVEVVMST